MKRRVLLLAGVAVSAAFLGAGVFGDTPLYRHVLTASALTLVASAFKLAALGSGAVFASRTARAFDAGSPMRSTWWLMSAWFACFFAGQAVLTGYEIARGSAPVPSVGDAAFLAGYLPVIAATVRFLVVYRTSGFALGKLSGHVVTAVAAALASIAVGVAVLGPLLAATATSPSTTGRLERAVNLGYPALDLVLLVPTVVLLRMTYAFRGGRLWTVWATLLAGVCFFTVGDVLFAVPGLVASRLGPWVDLAYMLGYGFAAGGAWLNCALLEE